jgi:hypothetical protein
MQYARLIGKDNTEMHVNTYAAKAPTSAIPVTGREGS